MTDILAINGFKRSGKNTTAGFVPDYYSGITAEVGFADALKLLAAYSLGYEGDEQMMLDAMNDFKERGKVVSGTARPKFVQKPDGNWDTYEPIKHIRIDGRRMLQQMGTKARDLLNPDVWINAVLPEPLGYEYQQGFLQSLYPDTDLVIVTDLRFANEAERVLALGGTVWEVVRDGMESDGHASEQVLPRHLVTRTITNNGTLDDLQQAVKTAVGEDL